MSHATAEIVDLTAYRQAQRRPATPQPAAVAMPSVTPPVWVWVPVMLAPIQAYYPAPKSDGG